MATRIEKREISSRLKGYTSLLLGISFVSFLAIPANADDNPQGFMGGAQESTGTPIEAGAPAPSSNETPNELTYDRALQELMKTQAHSKAAAQWGKTRNVKVPSGADPSRVIQEELIQAPGLMGLETGTPDPKKVEPIKVNGDLSKAQKVGLNGKPVADESGQDESGWDWTAQKGNQAGAEAAPPAAVEQQAVEPPAPKVKPSSFTTVFDADTGVGADRVQQASPENQVNVASEDQPSAAPQAATEEETSAPAAAENTEEEEGPPKTAAEVAKEAVTVYNGAVKLHLAGKLDEAITEYRSALSTDPELSQAHCNLGLIFNQQHDYAKALTEFRKALAIDPKDAITYNGIGAALRAQKDMEGAIKNWKTAVTIDPHLATAHYNLGTVYEIQKDFDHAVEAYSEAIKNDFRLGEAHYRLGLILVKKNRVEDAKEQFEKALQVSKNAEYCADARKRLSALEQPAAR